MKLELEIYSSLCAASKFIINGICAESSDFGYQGDQDDDSPEYHCGDMQFEGKRATQDVLDKYGISISEYNFIVGQLEAGLSFGSCGSCS